MEPADLAEAAAEQGKDDDGADAAGRLTYEIFSLRRRRHRPCRSDRSLPARALVGGQQAGLHPLHRRRRARLRRALSRGRARPSRGRAAPAHGQPGRPARRLLRRRRGVRRRRRARGLALRPRALRPAHVHRPGGAGLPPPPRGGPPRGPWQLVLPRRRHQGLAFGRALGELTLRDTVRGVLVPCYDVATRAPFLFSRAAAAGSAAHDFRLRDVCAATCAAGDVVVEVASVDGATRVRAVGGAAALRNPTAAAITHVLNNRREFPGAVGIGDLLVVSIGTGEAAEHRRKGGAGKPEVARIAADGVSDMVDQAVAMAFGQSRTSNYIRIQGTAVGHGGGRAPRACGGETEQQAVWKAEAMLLQKSVESVLFQGRTLAGETNAEKLERLARELTKEHARRKHKQMQLGLGGGLVAGTPQATMARRRRPPQLHRHRRRRRHHQRSCRGRPLTMSSASTSTGAAAAPDHRRRRRQHVDSSGTR